MEYPQRFIELYKNNITREGADKLLEYLLSSACDFFIAPASIKYHGSYPGGLVEHSLNTYECLVDYLQRLRTKEMYNMNYSQESIAIVSLLHDICKINCYRPSTRNVKDENGIWYSVPWYDYEDNLPYGHGEKSAYIVSGYMKLTRDEAFAIRYHMGFSGNEDKWIVGSALQKYPLAFALSVADMEATYYMEKSEDIK